MNRNDLLTEAEALELTGVTPATLNRFAEAGYFQVQVGKDGLRSFSRSELRSIFGLEESPSRQATHAAASLTAQIEVETIPESNTTPVSQSSAITPEEPAPLSPTDPSPETASANSEAPPLPPQNVALQLQELTTEVQRLRALNNLHERLLDLKEGEIKDLRGQRDWLRQRVEKLEEKSERDQFLLLSETQTIRKLIRMQNERKSPFRAALDWLGFSDSQNISQENSASEGQTTIEVSRSRDRK